MCLLFFYDLVIINFDAAPPDLLTFNGVVAQLLNKKKHQGSSSEIKIEYKIVFIVKKQVLNQADVICYFCD